MFRQRFSTFNPQVNSHPTSQHTSLNSIMKMYLNNEKLTPKIICKAPQIKICGLTSLSTLNIRDKTSPTKVVLFSQLVAQGKLKNKNEISPIKTRKKATSDIFSKFETVNQESVNKNSQLKTFKQLSQQQTENIFIKKRENTLFNHQQQKSIKNEPYDINILEVELRQKQKDQNQLISYSFKPQETNIQENKLNIQATNEERRKQLSLSSEINDEKIAKRDSAKKEERIEEKENYENVPNPYSSISKQLSVSRCKSKQLNLEVQSKEISLNLSSPRSNSPQMLNNSTIKMTYSKQNISFEMDIAQIFNNAQPHHTGKNQYLNQQEQGQKKCEKEELRTDSKINHRYSKLPTENQNPYCKQIESQILETQVSNKKKYQQLEEDDFDFGKYSFELSLDHIVTDR